MMQASAQMFYAMLALPTLFGLTMVGEGVYKISHYEQGWVSIILGTLFLLTVVFGYFILRGYF